MNTLVVSSPHTGTRFMRTITGGDGIHCFDHERLKIAKDRYTHFICPLRDPKAVWQSYCTRMDTGHQVRNGMRGCFEDLIKCFEYLDMYVCPVDLGDRSRELSEYLGRPIEWSTELVGHIEPTSYIEKDLSWFYELDFIKRFYA